MVVPGESPIQASLDGSVDAATGRQEPVRGADKGGATRTQSLLLPTDKLVSGFRHRCLVRSGGEALHIRLL